MLNFDVEILVNDSLTTINFSDYIKNKTVLVCPGIKNMDWPTLDYYRYVDSLFDSYKIDEILLVNHTDDLFFHMHINSHFPRLTTVTDRKQNYIKELKHNKKMHLPQSELVEKWAFQHLLKNGKEEGFWQQPLSNQWDHFWQKKADIKSILQGKTDSNASRTQTAKVLQKLYKTHKKSNMHDFTCVNWLYITEEGTVILKDLAPLIYYFDLIHNKNLESKLVLVDK